MYHRIIKKGKVSRIRDIQERNNKNSISGKLVGADGFSVTIEQGTGHTVILDRKNITRAKLVVKL